MIFKMQERLFAPSGQLVTRSMKCMRAHKNVSRSEAKDRAMDLFDKLNFKDSQRVWDSYPLNCQVE